jgi:muramidase (phage lysozyme)
VAALSPAEAGGKNVVAFLDLLAFSEGTSTDPITKNDGYDVIVDGIQGRQVFEDYNFHPFAKGRRPIIVHEHPDFLESTASGRYQILLRTWAFYRGILHYTDFEPITQDRIAIELIKERHALPFLLAGNMVTGAIKACSNIWASLPGSEAGQGGKPMSVLVAKYNEILAAM